MAEFTKGIWKHNRNTAIMSAHTLAANGKDYKHPVAAVFGAATLNTITDTTEPFANARLIENAPVMFELLEKVGREISDFDTKLSKEIDALLAKISPVNDGNDDEPRKPCPFCGCANSEIIHVVPEKQYCVECSQCECSTRICNTLNEAVDLWNTRDNPERTERKND